MPKAYIISRRAISYRRYIIRSDRNGYHYKNQSVYSYLRDSIYKSFYKKHQKNNNKECNWNSHYSN